MVPRLPGAGRPERPARGVRGVVVAWAVAGALLAASPAPAASSGTVHGAEMAGYGRVVFDLDSLPRASVKVANGILVVSFEKPVGITGEKLATEMPSYVSAVRVDPDGKAVRFALQRNVRPNMMEAGEKLFLDFLPETWKGMPPGLPQDVVDALSKRAKEAEETARMLARKRASEEVRDLPFRVGTTPTFTRIVFEMPVVAPVEMKREGDSVELVFDSALRLDPAKLRAALPQFVTGVEAEPIAGGLKVTLGVPAALDVRNFREDDSFALDIPTPKPPKAAGKGKDGAKDKDGKSGDPKEASAKEPPKPGAAEAGRSAPSRAPGAAAESREVADAGEPVSPESPPRGPASAEAAAPPIAPAPTPAVPVDLPLVPFQKAGEEATLPEGSPQPIAVAAEHGTVRLSLPLSPKVPLAVFERGGTVWIAAETPAALDPTRIGMVAPGLVDKVDSRRIGRLSILRLALARTPLVRATALPSGWVVTLGDDVAGPADVVALSHGIDTDGRTVVRTSYRDVGGVHWVEDPDIGDRIAIVTGRNAARSLLKAQTFVDFRALATATGLAVVPSSDDVAVKVGLDDVTITRDGGLAVSLVVDEPKAVRAAAAGAQLAIEREAWRHLRAGDVRERGRDLMAAAAEASKRSRGEARLDYARFLVANRLAPEALGALDVTTSDEPDLARDRSAQILGAMAQLMARRFPEAGKILNSDMLKDDPEGILWRAYLDAKEGRWQQALIGFRRSEATLAAYPEDLQAMLGPVYAEAAIAGRDFGLAQKVLDTLDGIEAEPEERQEALYLAARVAEGLGRVDEALGTYDKLVRTAERPVQAKARLAAAELALKDRTISRQDAIKELEGVSVTWRGDEVEARSLALLGRLYAEDERWRDAFSMARRANELFPESEITRTLYDETGSRFEALFLDNKADTIPRLDAIALYFDFKEFTPPGRRGDEMIRRLAERLVTLDLLTEAADLLQYQVDNRLNGAAKSSVATRLAVLRLMNRQPAKAYQALKDSRLAELPADLKRARLLLETRALSDLSRTDLALEMLGGEEGQDVDRLRTDILWQSRRWREAGEAFEKTVGDAWQSGDPLDDRQRMDVLRAAIAYGLGDEKLSLDRLRAKFATKMSDSADSRAFSVLTAPDGALSGEYRDIAKSVANADTLAEFLNEFRKRYPDTPKMPARDAAVPAAPAEPKPAEPKSAEPKSADTKPAEPKPAAGDAQSKPEATPAEGKPAAASEPAGDHKPSAEAEPPKDAKRA